MRTTPPGPDKEYPATEDLLVWMGRQFDRFGDTYKASIYGTPVYVTRDPDFTRHVLVDNWQNYVKGQFIKRVAFLLGNGLMVSEGELWKRQRRMIQPAFHPHSIAALTGMMAAVNAALRDKWLRAAQKNESINVTRDVSGMALEVVLRSILGEDYAQVGSRFAILSEEPARDLAFAQAFRALGAVVLQVADERRKNPADRRDILDLLLRAQDPQTGEFMPDRQIINEVLTLIVAGHETTASTLNWTWYLISRHPQVEERLSRELDAMSEFPAYEDLSRFPYSRQILEESMRLYPAGWLMTRKALKDDQLGDYSVAAGTEIYLSPYFIHRHPRLWEEPDRFDPDRFAPDNVKDRHRMAMLPFSTGPRNCIGALLARVEMQIHLLTIARHLRLRYTPSRQIEFDAGVNLRSKYDFIMRPEFSRHSVDPGFD